MGFTEKCDPQHYNFCNGMQMAMQMKFFDIRLFAGKFYVCCDCVSLEKNESLFLELKDAPVLDGTGEIIPNTFEEQQAIVLKGANLVRLNIMWYCSFCGVKLELPNKKMKEVEKEIKK